MCTVEVPTCRPVRLSEVMRRLNRMRNLLNRLNDDDNNTAATTDEGFQSARRILFDDGPVDHELRAQLLARETERMRRDVSAKWNFDFETETPLKGRFLWTPVFENSNQAGMLGIASLARPRTSPPSQGTEPVQPSPSEEPLPELIPVPSSSSETEDAKPEVKTRRMTKQRKLTDFMTQRKRSSTTPSKASSECKVRRTSTPTTATTTA